MKCIVGWEFRKMSCSISADLGVNLLFNTCKFITSPGDIQIPGPPTNVHASETSKTYVVLSWDPPVPRGKEPLMYFIEKVRYCTVAFSCKAFHCHIQLNSNNFQSHRTNNKTSSHWGLTGPHTGTLEKAWIIKYLITWFNECWNSRCREKKVLFTHYCLKREQKYQYTVVV